MQHLSGGIDAVRCWIVHHAALGQWQTILQVRYSKPGLVIRHNLGLTLFDGDRLAECLRTGATGIKADTDVAIASTVAKGHGDFIAALTRENVYSRRYIPVIAAIIRRIHAIGFRAFAAINISVAFH